MIGVGIGLPFFKSFGGIDAQAQAHFNRVIADGGLVPSGLSGVNAFFNTIKTIYGTADINTAISVGLDAQVLGYKLGAGSGTTLGQAAQKLYSPKDVFGGIGTSSAFWEGSGVAGNFVSTPNAAANQITGDIEIVAKVSFNTLSGYQMIISKANGNSYRLYKDLNVKRFVVEFGGKGGATSDLFTFDLQEDFWIKVNRVSLTGVVIFYKSTDGITYNQVGTTKSTTSGNFNNSSGLLEVGADGAGSQNLFTGKIYRVTLSNSIGGAPVVDFNPNQYTGANTWTSTTSEVWTVNSTGAGLADVIQTTAASQPLLLVHSGSNYFWGSGVSGNYCSTPNAAANNFGGAIDIKVLIKPNMLGVAGALVNNAEGQGGNGYSLQLTSSDNLRFGTATFGVNSSVALANTNPIWVRVTSTGNLGTITFYTSTDGINWTSGGTATDSTRGASSSQLGIGALNNGNFAFNGAILRLTISNSIDGAPVVDFNPNTYNAATSQTQWTSSTGEVWTINTGTATTGYKGVLVDRTIAQGDGVDDTLTNLSFNQLSPFTYNLAFKQYQLTAPSAKGVLGRGTNKVALGVGSYTTTPDTTWTWAPNELTTYGGSNDMDKNLNLFQSIIPSMTETGWSMRKNNSNFGAVGETSGTPIDGGAIYLFYSGIGSEYSNSIINTALISSNSQSIGQSTAMYDYIKSINNSAF
jgi:hypothetical protein